jgi:hypothetical protein
MDDELPLSAVALVTELRIGEAYAKAIYIPETEFSADEIQDARRRLMHTLSSVIARVRAKWPYRRLRIFTTIGFTNTYDVVVTGIILREENDR